MSAPLFYENPIPLNPQTHRHLRIKLGNGDFNFTRKTNSVVLAGAEFPEACKYFPIAFAKVAGRAAFPVALLGYRDQENLFVDDAGKWRCAYVPAYIRRYPFIPARRGAGSDFAVYIDESYPGFSASEGQPLFAGSGEPADHLKSVMAFLQDYQRQSERTESFLQTLRELDLLKDFTASVKLPNGESCSVSGLMVVDEGKLQALPDAQILRLFRSGGLAWVYSHLASIGNLNRMPHKAPETEIAIPEKAAHAPKAAPKGVAPAPRNAAPANRKSPPKVNKPAKK